MVCMGIEVRSWMDYVLGTNRHLFRNMSVWETMHYSDHYTILGCLHSDALREHTKYFRRRTHPPLPSPTTPTR